MIMKITDLKDEMKAMSKQELKTKIESLRRQLLNLKINVATAHVKDYSEFQRLRRDIARGLTYLRQKEE